MDLVRAFACSRTMWSRASGSSVAIRTRSFEERFSVTTITVGRSRAHKWRPRQHAHDWPVHTANVARSFGRYSNSHSAQPPFPIDELASPAFGGLLLGSLPTNWIRESLAYQSKIPETR
jgi:hypothetical protein